MNILVTGGAGFIGSHVVDLLLDRGDRVVILDSLDPQVHGTGPGGSPVAWPEWTREARRRGARLYQIELPDADRVGTLLDHEQIEAVVHLAARVGVGQSAYEIASYTETNATGTASLLDEVAKRRDKIRRVVVAGSMSCYGEGAVLSARGVVPGWDRSEADLVRGEWDLLDRFDLRCGDDGGGSFALPVATREEIPLRCTSVYAETKRIQEELTRIVCSTYGISWAVTRFFNVYGPRQALSNPYTGVAAIFSARIRAGRPPLVFEDGEQGRDFIHVDDVARAVLALVDRPEAVGAFNVGTGVPTSIREVAEVLGRVLDRPDLGVEVTGRFRVGDVRTCFADVRRIHEATGWRAEVGLHAGLSRLAAWVSAQAEPEDGTDRAVRELRTRGLVR